MSAELLKTGKVLSEMDFPYWEEAKALRRYNEFKGYSNMF